MTSTGTWPLSKLQDQEATPQNTVVKLLTTDILLTHLAPGTNIGGLTIHQVNEEYI